MGKHYGFPDCYGIGRRSNCDGTTAATLELEANSSSDGLALALAVTAVIVIVVTVGLYALGRAANVGPFAPGVPTSWLFAAISRSGEVGDAREIEVIDLATGDRQLFTLDDRALDIALSH